MPKAYIINTNKSNKEYDYESDMINNEKCAAYFSPEKEKIDRIEASDIVFLYSNNNGIIARGMATGLVEVAECQGIEDEEHYMHLNRFELISPAVESVTINKETDSVIVLNRTVIEVPYDKALKLWQYMTKKGLHKKEVTESSVGSRVEKYSNQKQQTKETPYSGW